LITTSSTPCSCSRVAEVVEVDAAEASHAEERGEGAGGVLARRRGTEAPSTRCAAERGRYQVNLTDAVDSVVTPARLLSTPTAADSRFGRRQP
jgi:hypothetical protein